MFELGFDGWIGSSQQVIRWQGILSRGKEIYKCLNFLFTVSLYRMFMWHLLHEKYYLRIWLYGEDKTVIRTNTVRIQCVYKNRCQAPWEYIPGGLNLVWHQMSHLSSHSYQVLFSKYPDYCIVSPPPLPPPCSKTPSSFTQIPAMNSWLLSLLLPSFLMSYSQHSSKSGPGNPGASLQCFLAPNPLMTPILLRIEPECL